MTVKKTIVIAGAVLIAIVIACIIVYRLLTTGHVEPLALLLFAGLISIMLPIIRANFFPSARDCDAEFAFHTRRRDVFIRQQVIDSLGEAAWQQIAAPPRTLNENPEDFFSALLAGGEAESNADLRFALLAALSGYHEKAGDPQAAIASLAAAQKLRPQDFMTLFSLARNYAWKGNPDAARRILHQILASPAGLSRAMIKLTRRHLEELEAR